MTGGRRTRLVDHCAQQISHSLPPSSPNHPSPIHVQPCDLAASSPPPPKASHEQRRLTMDNAGHKHGANLNHDSHMDSGTTTPYYPLARHQDPYNHLLPPEGHKRHEFLHGQAAEILSPFRKRPKRAVQVCSLCSPSTSTMSSSAILIVNV